MISGGRVIFGIGYGWNKEEMANHGVSYLQRRALVREKILMMKEIWSKDEASFDGEHLHLEPSWSWPKPVQRPHPPIVLGGGAGPKTFADVAEFCDGWMPVAGRHGFLANVDTMRTAARAAGRDPSGLSVGVFGAPPDLEDLRRLADAGVDRAVLAVPSKSPAEVLARLDRYAPLVDELRDA